MGSVFKHVAVSRCYQPHMPDFAGLNRASPVVVKGSTLPRRLREGEVFASTSLILMAGDEFHNGRGDASRHAMVDLGGARTLCSVTLRKDGTLLGYITIYRQEVRPFGNRQIALLQNFAAQAVIAMEKRTAADRSARGAGNSRPTAEVLQVINASQGNLAPVFDTMLERGLRLCSAAFGSLLLHDDGSLITPQRAA